MTIPWRVPVRVNMPVQIGPYTFTDQNSTPINLSAYVSVNCELKLEGQAFATVGATFITPSAGTVQLSTYTFTSIGIWTAQFVCVDGSGNKLYGEPVQFAAVDNVDTVPTNNLLPL